MNSYKIALLDGDGIGPEIMAEAIKVLDLIADRNDVSFELIHAPFGACAYFSHGNSFPEETKAVCDAADAILKGPIGLSHEDSKKYQSICNQSVARYFLCVDDTTLSQISDQFFYRRA